MKTDRAGLVKVIYRGCPEIVSSRSIRVASMPVSSRGIDRHHRASLTLRIATYRFSALSSAIVVTSPQFK